MTWFALEDDSEMLQQQIKGSDPREHSSKSDGRGYVVGVDIGGSRLRVGLAGMSGGILHQWSASTKEIRDPHEILQQIRCGVESILGEGGVSPNLIHGIGVGTPGVVDTKRGVVLATSYLMGWKDVAFRSMLREEFGVAAAIENDVNLAAIGERHAGSAQGSGDFVFLAVGTGIGAGIFIDGRLHHGLDWKAGEVGYMLLPGTDVVPSKPHEPGAMEKVAGGAGLSSLWRDSWRSDVTSLPKDATVTDIFDQAVLGDSRASELLGLSSRTLAYTIMNLSIVLNCRLFVLGGTVGLHPAYASAVRDVLDGLGSRGRLDLVPSALGTEAQLIGAVILARQIANGMDVDAL